MTEKNAIFAVVVGEVSPEFYGRVDLAKYPLGMSMVENFFVDYKGGMSNRPGTQFLLSFMEQPHYLARFRAGDNDYVLLFLDTYAFPILNGSFIPNGASFTMTRSGEWYEAPGHGFSVGHMAATDSNAGLMVSDVSGDSVRFKGPSVAYYNGGDSITVRRLYCFAHGFPGHRVRQVKYYQDLDYLVLTHPEHAPKRVKFNGHTNWVVSNQIYTLSSGPNIGYAAANSAGSASVAFRVSAVINGQETQAGPVRQVTGIVDYTTTAGYVHLTWDAVPGASHYLVYRTLVYPAALPNGPNYGYTARTTGTEYYDRNDVPDFTKSPIEGFNPFSNNNHPGLYARFQQRGIYAGVKNQPLTVYSSIAGGANDNSRGTMARTPIPVATDSFEYTIDAESFRPIKHVLPLRYGLMLFTDDVVAQLRAGGDSRALTALNAFAETQGYVSVSDMPPIAINLDLIFMTALNTELNVMLYTEYTNSFQMQDILVLSAHLFGPNNPATRVEWAAEPHKVAHFVRQDGQKVILTYERNQEVFGFTRYRTLGEYQDNCVIREDSYNLPYLTVRRRINGRYVTCLERERPRAISGYNKYWFLDCALERELIAGTQVFDLVRGEGEGEWIVENVGAAPFAFDPELDYRVYIRDKLFRVASQSPTVVLKEMQDSGYDDFYESERVRIDPSEYSYNHVTNTIQGLSHLNGERVSVQVDGDVYEDLLVEDGQVSFDNPGARILAGLPYKSRAKTLPLTVDGAILDGTPMALRGVTTRLHETRGLRIGGSFDDLQEIYTYQQEDWGNPQVPKSGLAQEHPMGNFDDEAFVCLEQSLPLPATILSLTFNLDVGED